MNLEPKKRIAVLGDLILDEFVFGSVNRINPEAPVPVLKAERRELRLGGAGNVANNIVALGGDCLLVGKTGPGDQLPQLLAERKIDHQLLFDPQFRLIKKSRFVADNQQLLRVDEETPRPLASAEVGEMLKAIEDIDLVVVSDYGKGFVTTELMDGLRRLKKTILVDPKVCQPELFHDVELLKPNSEETKYALRMDIENEVELVKAATDLQKLYSCNLLITRGKDGMSLFELGEEPIHIPTQAKEVFDVTGAGDTVMAALAVALAAGETLQESVILANHAAGIVVSKVGTATVTRAELEAALAIEEKKIKTADEMTELLRNLRNKGARIVFTNGCFDILHIGHTRLLRQAKSFGDVLILGLNSDASIRRLKGPSRPIVSEKERAEILSSLACVDFIVFFSENDPCRLIAELRPDVHVKGGDYDPQDVERMPEAQIIHEYGGRIEIVDVTEGRSTTGIIEKVRGPT